MGDQRSERPSGSQNKPPDGPEWSRVTDEGLLTRSEALVRAQRLQTFGRIAGRLAHDLNNLLTSIAGNLDLLVAELPQTATGRAITQDLHLALARAADLTNQLVAFGRQPRPARERVVDLNEVISELHLLVDRVLGEAVKLDLILSEHSLPVRIDPADLEQALMNAVLNAREAMPEGGMLTLVTERVETRHPEATGPEEVSLSPFIRLRIRDSGAGMSRALLPHIFEPFFTTRTTGPHAGLGLFVIQTIVHRAGGFVSVHSEPGWGVTLDLYFPESDASTEPSDSWLSDALRGNGETILVVEDEAVVRQVTRRVLERLGYRVLLASQGAEAMRLAAHNRVDLLLTDVVLPHMNGLDLAHRLRSRQPELRVLFMSGYSTTEMDLTRAPAVEHFLSKPFSPRSLAARVRHALRAPPGDLPDAADWV